MWYMWYMVWFDVIYNASPVDAFSEKTRNRKSPSWSGSKVDGMTIYEPGSNLNLPTTSLKLMKLLDRAQLAL